MTLRQLVQEKQDALAGIDATADAEVAVVRDRAAQARKVIEQELAEAGILPPTPAPVVVAVTRTGIRAGIRKFVLSLLDHGPVTRRVLLAHFPKVRAGSIDNTLATLIREGRIVRVREGEYMAAAA